MHGQAGYTLIELLVAAALMLLLTAVTCQVLVNARATIDVSAERASVQQGARVALDAIAAHIRGAGAGPNRGGAIGRLQQWGPPILPGRPGDLTTFSTAVTAFEALSHVPAATLAFDAPAGGTILDFTYAPGCAAPCGFFDGMTVLVADGLGAFDLFALPSIDGAMAVARRLATGTGAAYARGTPVLPVDLRTYYHNDRSLELRVFDGDRSDMPVVNDVVELALEYFARRPDGALERLEAANVQNGPWYGAGSQPFDADLLRIRAVRISLRLQAGNPAHRGADPRWFRNPGTAVESIRMVKDISLRTTITPRNLGPSR